MRLRPSAMPEVQVPAAQRHPSTQTRLRQRSQEDMKGEFVDINQEGARAEVAHLPDGHTNIKITRACDLDEKAWRVLVEEVDAMIERTKS
jgi:hypothetical protein